jgi:hypothetical protein
MPRALGRLRLDKTFDQPGVAFKLKMEGKIKYGDYSTYKRGPFSWDECRYGPTKKSCTDPPDMRFKEVEIDRFCVLYKNRPVIHRSDKN